MRTEGRFHKAVSTRTYKAATKHAGSLIKQNTALPNVQGAGDGQCLAMMKLQPPQIAGFLPPFCSTSFGFHREFAS